MTTRTIKWDIPTTTPLTPAQLVALREINRDESVAFAHRNPTRTKAMIHAMRIARESNVRLAAARHNGR